MNGADIKAAAKRLADKAAAKGGLYARRRVFGANVSGTKVYLSALWVEMGTPCDLDAFKAAMVEFNRRGEIELSRADLVQAMPADVVELSEARYLNATFHFVRVD
jgi:hypothetical protein